MIIAVYLLVAFFVFASSIKIFAWQKMIFDTQMGMICNYGLTREHFRMIGVLELIGAVALFFSPSLIGFAGAVLIAFVSLGALTFHLRYDTWQQGIASMVTLTLSTLVAVWQRDFFLQWVGG